jgi:hypothetical protein
MMTNDESWSDGEESGLPETVISIDQSIALKHRVAQGEFASFEEAPAKSKEELNLSKVGDDWYSEEVLSWLKEGIQQVENGEVIPGEIAMAELDARLKELEDGEIG